MGTIMCLVKLVNFVAHESDRITFVSVNVNLIKKKKKKKKRKEKIVNMKKSYTRIEDTRYIYIKMIKVFYYDKSKLHTIRYSVSYAI